MILIDTDDSSFYYDIQSLTGEFFPGEEIKEKEKRETGDPSPRLSISVHFTDRVVSVSADYWRETGEISDQGLPKMEKRSQNGTALIKDIDRPEVKNRLKRVLYDVLSKVTGQTLPWGTLSGIRPTKLVLSRVEEGMPPEEIEKDLYNTYYLSPEKTDLAIEIAEREHEILSSVPYKNGWSLYIGIPFCPSICLYCSFSSYPIAKYEEKVSAYIKALDHELAEVAEMTKGHPLTSIYIGGGTPTSLSADQLSKVLESIHRHFDFSTVAEFTVEAGRPDSITPEKLRVMKEADVERISINPQTMNDKTLEVIGRSHRAADIERAFGQAREAGFVDINMDVIVGLPGEGRCELAHTIAGITKLRPDCLTVHSLARKRAARLTEEWEKYADTSFENSEMYMKMFEHAARAMGMVPYYLYRQKNMAGNLENTGYALPERPCLYNILIMEEKQPIIACGAGGASKYTIDGTKTDRSENVKDPEEYISRIDEMIERKREKLKELTWL